MLRLKLYRRSCVDVESMLYVNQIRGSIIIVVIFGGKTPRRPTAKRVNEATTGQNLELEQSWRACAARLRKKQVQNQHGSASPTHRKA